MAPPLPNSAHTEISSYLRNLAVPRGLNLSARNRSKELSLCFRQAGSGAMKAGGEGRFKSCRPPISTSRSKRHGTAGFMFAAEDHR